MSSARIAIRTLEIAAAIAVASWLVHPLCADESVVDVVRAEFARWDADGDGRLTVEEVDHAVLDPSVRGNAAAALACIKAIERRNTDRENKTPPITMAQLDEYEAERAKGRADEDDDYDEWFGHYRTKLKATSRELFPQGKPRLERIKQGDLGDCFCVAMIGSLVHRDPPAFVGTMSRNEDGTYTVRFSGTHTATIKAPTDTEIAINSSARENGLWLTVFEKAIGTIANRLTPPGKRTVEPTDAIAYGGLAGDAIELFTGHDHVFVERTDGELHEALSAGVTGRCLMYSVLRRDIDEPAGLIDNHVYAVIGYDAATRTVRIFDPRGIDHAPTGDPGTEHGYAMADGIFSVPLADFVAVFGGVGVEDRRAEAHK